VGKPRTRWKEVVRTDTSQILGIRGWRRRAEDKEEWRRLLRETRAQYGLYDVDGKNGMVCWTQSWGHMTGPIEGSSVETQARYYIFKIVLLDFRRLFHRCRLQSQWSDIRFSDTPLYPTQPNDMLFTIFCSVRMHKLKLSCTGKAKKPRTVKNLTRNDVPVSYKKEKNVWMDSEIFWDQSFDKFPPYQTLR
jgi:hypothetical protein